jgi:hypothetical protein
MVDRAERIRPGRRESAKILTLTIALYGLCAISAARAQNLLPNNGFNADIGGWTPNYSGGISLGWNALDAKSSSGSGSLRITNTDPVDNNGYNVFGICLPVTAGQTWRGMGSVMTCGIIGLDLPFLRPRRCGRRPFKPDAQILTPSRRWTR